MAIAAECLQSEAILTEIVQQRGKNTYLKVYSLSRWWRRPLSQAAPQGAETKRTREPRKRWCFSSESGCEDPLSTGGRGPLLHASKRQLDERQIQRLPAKARLRDA